MTGLSVIPGERGVLRLFTLDMRPEEAKFLREPGAAAQVLGIGEMDHTQVEVFPVSDLEDLGLSGYLTEGCGIAQDQLDPEMLDAITGWVMVVRSKAFGGRAVTLQPDPRVRLAGLYTEETTSWTGPRIETESARPYSAPRVAPRQARSQARRIGFALFAVIMALIIGGVLWLVM